MKGGSPRVVPLSIPASDPSCAPDGRTVAFVSCGPQLEGELDCLDPAVWRVRTDGTGLVRLGAAAGGIFTVRVATCALTRNSPRSVNGLTWIPLR